MPEQEWGQDGMYDAPVTRRAVDEIRIERPPGLDQVPAVLPPGPDVHSLRATLENPQLADEVWRRVDADQLPAEQDSEQHSTLAELATAVYLLHAVHSQNSPTQE